jgi:hypothetical protein
MTTHELIPFVGIGPARLGMTRDELRESVALPFRSFRKTPDSEHETDQFLGNGFQVFYTGAAPVVEYIEVTRDAGSRVVYREVDVFDKEAAALVALICRDAPFDSHHPEIGHTYVFPDLDLALWRPVLVRSHDGHPSKRWTTIGIGVRGYFSQRASRPPGRSQVQM